MKNGSSAWPFHYHEAEAYEADGKGSQLATSDFFFEIWKGGRPIQPWLHSPNHQNCYSTGTASHINLQQTYSQHHHDMYIPPPYRPCQPPFSPSCICFNAGRSRQSRKLQVCRTSEAKDVLRNCCIHSLHNPRCIHSRYNRMDPWLIVEGRRD